MATWGRRIITAGAVAAVLYFAIEGGEWGTMALVRQRSHTAALKDTLRANAGKNVTLTSKVDPSLLGGMIVKIGSRMIDSSLKTKLANLSIALKA